MVMVTREDRWQPAMATEMRRVSHYPMLLAMAKPKAKRFLMKLAM
jgi:hypothetical protein